MEESLSNKDKTDRGIDVSSYRLDTLERKAVEGFLSFANNSVMVNLGSGKARSSVILALLGYRTRNYDICDYSDYFADLSVDLGLPNSRLRFDQLQLSKIPRRKLPKKIHGVIANRALHYLPYESAVRVLEMIGERLSDDARVYIGLSGLDTVLGRGYGAGDKRIEERFGKLSPQMQKRFSITEDICLYKRKDVESLVTQSGLKLESIEKSAFGNWKIVCRKTVSP